MGSLVFTSLCSVLESVVAVAHLSAKYGEMLQDVLSFSTVNMMHSLMP